MIARAQYHFATAVNIKRGDKTFQMDNKVWSYSRVPREASTK